MDRDSFAQEHGLLVCQNMLLWKVEIRRLEFQSAILIPIVGWLSAVQLVVGLQDTSILDWKL